MPVWLSDEEYTALEVACERLLPATDRGPGATAAGVVGYIDQLLGAFTFDPPATANSATTDSRWV